MKVGIFLSYIGLGSNLLHLTYCHQIAKKYGPVSIVTICKNLEQALEDDPLIKEVIYIDSFYKKFFDIFKLSKHPKALLISVLELYPRALNNIVTGNFLLLSIITKRQSLISVVKSTQDPLAGIILA